MGEDGWSCRLGLEGYVHGRVWVELQARSAGGSAGASIEGAAGKVWRGVCMGESGYVHGRVSRELQATGAGDAQGRGGNWGGVSTNTENDSVVE